AAEAHKSGTAHPTRQPRRRRRPTSNYRDAPAAGSVPALGGTVPPRPPNARALPPTTPQPFLPHPTIDAKRRNDRRKAPYPADIDLKSPETWQPSRGRGG